MRLHARVVPLSFSCRRPIARDSPRLSINVSHREIEEKKNGKRDGTRDAEFSARVEETGISRPAFFF